MNKIVVVSGGFDPVHSGHIELFKEASKLSDTLIVGLNSDAWLKRKKGYVFMPFKERQAVVESIKYVYRTTPFYDVDDSACELLEQIKNFHPHCKIIFANGGDRNESNNRESKVKGIEFVYGVGGSHKMNSSSEIVKKVSEIGL
jgi:cytidyltransferase-like protein